MFTLTPKHSRLVNSCYGSDHTGNLSVLLHHIHLKPERIKKVTSFLITKMTEEITNNKTCKMTCKIMLSIMVEFSDKSPLFEINVLKAVGEAIKKLTNKFMKEDSSVVETNDGVTKYLDSYEAYVDLLEIVEYFRDGMRSYEGEEQASKLITLVSRCVYDEFFVNLLCALIRIKDLFHHGYEKKIMYCVDALMCEKWVDRLVVLGEVINIVNVRIFCYEIIKKGSQRNINIEFIIDAMKEEMGVFSIIEINHYLIEIIGRLKEMIGEEKFEECESPSICSENSDFSQMTLTPKFTIKEDDLKEENANEKYDCGIRIINESNALKEINSHEGNDNLHELKNINDGDSKITSKINEKETNVIDAEFNKDLENLKIEEKEGNRDIVCKGATEELIFLGDLSNGSDDLSLGIKPVTKSNDIQIDPIFHPIVTTPKYKDIILLLTWATNMLPRYISHSVIELGQSYFTLLRGLYSVDSQIPHHESFIFKYIKNFLNNCPVTSDILYIYVKKPFQYNFAPNSKRVSVYTINFQSTILRLTKDYSHDHILILDSKFISLLVKISDHVYFHRESCYSILLNALRGAMPGGENGHALHGKIRSLYYQTGSETLFKILKLFVRFHEDREYVRETLKIMKNISNRTGKCQEDFMKLCKKTGNEDILIIEDYVYTKKDQDEKLYEEIYGVLYRLYSQSLKSSYNLECLAKKRKSRIQGVRFFN